MDLDETGHRREPQKSSRRGKCFLLMLAALICLAASYFAYAADITANAHRSSLIIGAFLGIVNLIMFFSIITATVLFLADFIDGN